MPAAKHLGVEPGALLDIADRDAEMRDGSDRDHHRPSRFAVCRLFMRARLRDLAERGARLLRRFASCNDILLAVITSAASNLVPVTDGRSGYPPENLTGRLPAIFGKLIY